MSAHDRFLLRALLTAFFAVGVLAAVAAVAQAIRFGLGS